MNVIALAPAASPSRPSVRLTALVVAVMRNQIQIMSRAVGQTKGVSLTRDTAFEAGSGRIRRATVSCRTRR